MRVLSAQDLDLAVNALQHVARYDSARLETYRQKEDLWDRIRVSPMGSALALRFDDVGYFNRLYAPDDAAFERLAEIEDFYRGSPFGCELVGPPADSFTPVGHISRPGWTPAARYAWLSSHGRLPAPAQPSSFTIHPPERSQRQLFLITYLRAFEAQENRIPSALRNMRHLFDRPDLHFLMAWHGDHPAGVAIMMRCGSAALFCAGAALPQFRKMGCHTALLDARIRLASQSGCHRLYSWAVLGSQSHANMERAGLTTAGISITWRFSPARSR